MARVHAFKWTFALEFKHRPSELCALFHCELGCTLGRGLTSEIVLIRRDFTVRGDSERGTSVPDRISHVRIS